MNHTPTLEPLPLPISGLTEAEALQRLQSEGANLLPQAQSRRVLKMMKGIVTEPMVALLIGCGSIYFFLGDTHEALMLWGFLFLIMGITFYQERRAEYALQALRNLSSPRALVIRDGVRKRIAGCDLVRGDILILSEGDKIPADAELLSSRNFSVDESLVTGESVPVIKMASPKEPLPFLYSGTTVVRGSGIARVSATGLSSEIGKIGKALKETPLETTPLQKETASLVRVVASLAAVLCLSVVVVYAIHRADWLEGLLAGLTLAMAILPNELPAVLTIFLALGAWRLSLRRVLTRQSPVVEALGAATVLCVDKTGTLTCNRMALRKLWTQEGSHEISVEPNQPLPESFHELIEFGILAGEREATDPMDFAFQKVGNDLLFDTEHLHPDWSLIQQYPLSEKLLAVSHVWKTIGGNALPIAAKGAPEAIVDLCHLPSQEAEAVLNQARQMGSQGYRVLGVAKANTSLKQLPNEAHDFDFLFVGLVGLQDPIRPEVPEAIKQCHQAGIRVVMITGDHADTALSIAKEIGLASQNGVLTGDEIRRISKAELQERLSQISVCARMLPEQKLALIEGFKARGEIVAMTGDGVNDAPALKSAHIGIAMGKRGTDVAREAASLVLLDDDFGSIVAAVRMGRRIDDNLRRAMAYLLAVHIPITGISVLPVFLNLPLVLLPIHIAFLHLIIEPVCSIAFEAESEAENMMNRKPRPIGEKLFSKHVLFPALGMGASLFVLVSGIYFSAWYLGRNESEIRALTFSVLVISNLGLLIGQRSLFQLFQNKVLSAISVASLILLSVILSVPAAQKLFRFSSISFQDILVCLIASASLPIALRAFRR